MHKGVGAIIKNDNNKVLMLDRVNFPYGWACPAGHIDKDEEPYQAMIREVKEETNIEVLKYKQVIHEFVQWNECSMGVRGHDWFVFEIKEWSGKLKQNKEAKQLSWIDQEKLKDLNLEPVWKYWFQKTSLIDK